MEAVVYTSHFLISISTSRESILFLHILSDRINPLIPHTAALLVVYQHTQFLLQILSLFDQVQTACQQLLLIQNDPEYQGYTFHQQCTIQLKFADFMSVIKIFIKKLHILCQLPKNLILGHSGIDFIFS